MVKRNNFKFLTKKEKREVIIYQLLGVNIFKQMTLTLEKIIHYHENKNITDEQYKKHNINYHPKDNTLQGLTDFKKFLYYNGSIHIKNSLIYSIVIVAVAFIPGLNIINVGMIPLLIMNLYCVMLQRYTYLRIEDSIRILEKHNEKMIARKVQKLEQINEKKEVIDPEKIDLELINKIEDYLNNKADAVISEKYLESLITINHYLSLLNQNKIVQEPVIEDNKVLSLSLK